MSSLSTTTKLFRMFQVPRSGFKGSTTGPFSHVAFEYAFMCSQYAIKDWKDFNEDASRVLTGKREVQIPSRDATIIEGVPRIHEVSGQPLTEGELVAAIRVNMAIPLNLLRGSHVKWRSSPPPATAPIDNKSRRDPDLALVREETIERGSSSKNPKSSMDRSVDKDLKLETIIAGEVKRPNLYLGSQLTKNHIDALIRHERFPEYNPAFPYFQLFSCMIRSTKGIGVLTNYDHSRFFKIDPKHKIMYMSPVVRSDQVLSTSLGTPHVLQTFLYAESLPDELRDEGIRKVLKVQLDEARRKAEEYEKKKAAEKAAKEAALQEGGKGSAASSSKDNKKHKDSSKSGGTHGKKRDESSWTVISPVTLVLDKCKAIGVLGEGHCGVIKECDYEGLKVALKVGMPFKAHVDEMDCYAIVKNEIECYERLEELQGKVIPRMVVGGLEKYYNPSSMVLITEKVGMGAELRDDKIYVNGKELNREDVVVMREKGVEGLKKMHEHGVAHTDAVLRNVRVEMRDGKVVKVWWIDLGFGLMIDFEKRRAIDMTGERCDMHYMEAMEEDIKRYTRCIDYVLKKMESE